MRNRAFLPNNPLGDTSESNGGFVDGSRISRRQILKLAAGAVTLIAVISACTPTESSQNTKLATVLATAPTTAPATATTAPTMEFLPYKFTDSKDQLTAESAIRALRRDYSLLPEPFNAQFVTPEVIALAPKNSRADNSIRAFVIYDAANDRIVRPGSLREMSVSEPTKYQLEIPEYNFATGRTETKIAYFANEQILNLARAMKANTIDLQINRDAKGNFQGLLYIAVRDQNGADLPQKKILAKYNIKDGVLPLDTKSQIDTGLLKLVGFVDPKKPKGDLMIDQVDYYVFGPNNNSEVPYLLDLSKEVKTTMDRQAAFLTKYTYGNDLSVVDNPTKPNEVKVVSFWNGEVGQKMSITSIFKTADPQKPWLFLYDDLVTQSVENIPGLTLTAPTYNEKGEVVLSYQNQSGTVIAEVNNRDKLHNQRISWKWENMKPEEKKMYLKMVMERIKYVDMPEADIAYIKDCIDTYFPERLPSKEELVSVYQKFPQYGLDIDVDYFPELNNPDMLREALSTIREIRVTDSNNSSRSLDGRWITLSNTSQLHRISNSVFKDFRAYIFYYLTATSVAILTSLKEHLSSGGATYREAIMGLAIITAINNKFPGMFEENYSSAQARIIRDYRNK